MKKDQREIFVTLKQRRFLLWTATRATAVARHGFDCCFSLSSSRSLSLFPPSFFFAPLRRVATHENSCYFTAGRRGRASPRRCGGANANSNSLFFIARATRIHRGLSASTSYGASTTIHILHTNAPVTRLYHLPRDSDRASRIFRARNRRASRKTITRTHRWMFARVTNCAYAYIENRGIVDPSLLERTCAADPK